jgi:membrane-bound lytic murein transglycosylase F
MRKHYIKLISFLLLLILAACSSEKKQKKDDITPSRDLKEIKENGILNVVTTYSSTSYFLYRGQPMGYEYDLLKRFAKHLDVELHLQVTNDIDSMFEMLNSGKVDLIAHGLTITGKRKEQVQFSDYLYLSHQVLVQKKPDNWRKLSWSKLQHYLIHDAIELIGDTVSVMENTSYFSRLKNLSEEIGGTIYIDTIREDISSDKIIEMVAQGKIKYTIADKNIASINASYYPELDIRVPISFSQRMAWAVRPESDSLRTALNEWISEMKKGVAYYAIYNKYFKNERGYRQRENSEYFSLNDNKISEFDDLLRQHADSLQMDWRLLASLVYQESKFNPNTESWAGAKGLMQIMPTTAKHFGITDITDPEQNLKAGTGLLKLLWNRFEDVQDSTQRIMFTLASYNCGYGHVLDAKTLAKAEGYNPLIWEGETEKAMMKLSYPENYNKPNIKYGYVRGVETVNFVDQILTRYEHYCQLVEE